MPLLPADVRNPKPTKRSKKKGESVMSRSKAERFRTMSTECERQAELASEEPEFRELQKRLAGAYAALAESEDWLDGRADTGTYLMPDLPAEERSRLLARAS
jgi:hypothetical protein